jgi:GDP/UDP-N,N'-diacetylbacillosamine 2-epimerase (hydrolysing)
VKRKICVITGSRADYGLLYWVIQRLSSNRDVELQLVVTGMHLSQEFGLTYKQIEADGFSIRKKLDIALESDSPAGISRSMGLAMISFADAYAELKPDLILVLGDRFEIFSAVAAAMVARIAVAHCHGGELTRGAIDDAFRHSITKMSHIHFTAASVYRDRVIQLGEHPDTVHVVGGLGIEGINRQKLMDRHSWEREVGFKLGEKNLLVTFHPVTLERASAEHQFSELLKALDQIKNTKLVFTMPNADTEGRVIMSMIRLFVEMRRDTAIAFESLGQIRYLSLLQWVDGVVGNSSSGLIEAPSFKIGTINIGDRQDGRLKAESVIDCMPEEASILDALKKLYSPGFRSSLTSVKNPYDHGNASAAICEVLGSVDITHIVKKRFYDVGGQTGNNK